MSCSCGTVRNLSCRDIQTNAGFCLEVVSEGLHVPECCLLLILPDFSFSSKYPIYCQFRLVSVFFISLKLFPILQQHEVTCWFPCGILLEKLIKVQNVIAAVLHFLLHSHTVLYIKTLVVNEYSTFLYTAVFIY